MSRRGLRELVQHPFRREMTNDHEGGQIEMGVGPTTILGCDKKTLQHSTACSCSVKRQGSCGAEGFISYDTTTFVKRK